jgi:hypothetical protein
VLEALGSAGVSWKIPYDTGSVETTNATVRADLAITTWLESTVPDDLSVLMPEAGLPGLPAFAVNLYRMKGETTPAAEELGRQIQLAMRRPGF